jgi:DNA replication protein DnaC
VNRTNDVVALLRQHRLGAMADRVLLQEAAKDKRPFLERLLEVVQAQDGARSERSMIRRTREARLRIEGADIADVWTGGERGLLKSHLDPFRNGGWVWRHEHLVIVGKSGRGTTYIACALAQAVLRDGLRVRYEEVPTLIAEWHAAHDAGRADDFVRALERADLLVLDDWGNTDETLELADIRGLRRCLRPMLENRSVLIVSKNPPEELGEWLGGRETADELVDRLSNVAHRLELKGRSLRTRPTLPREGRGASRSR